VNFDELTGGKIGGALPYLVAEHPEVPGSYGFLTGLVDYNAFHKRNIMRKKAA
jgi:hypothetical protein